MTDHGNTRFMEPDYLTTLLLYSLLLPKRFILEESLNELESVIVTIINTVLLSRDQYGGENSRILLGLFLRSDHIVTSNGETVDGTWVFLNLELIAQPSL
jgi:hypothetical protein